MVLFEHLGIATLIVAGFVCLYAGIDLIYKQAQVDQMRKHYAKQLQHEAVTKLRHAIEYLAPLGTGENGQYTSARLILNTAAHKVLEGN